VKGIGEAMDISSLFTQKTVQNLITKLLQFYNSCIWDLV